MTVEATVTDDLSGTNSARVTSRAPTGGQTTEVSSYWGNRISGNDCQADTGRSRTSLSSPRRPVVRQPVLHGGSRPQPLEPILRHLRAGSQRRFPATLVGGELSYGENQLT